MKHKFQDPHLKQLVKRLVELDLAKSTVAEDEGHFAIRKYETVAERASDYGVVFNLTSLAEVTDAANKESMRQNKPVGHLKGKLVHHPKVLDAVFATLNASERV